MGFRNVIFCELGLGIWIYKFGIWISGIRDLVLKDEDLDIWDLGLRDEGHLELVDKEFITEWLGIINEG